MFYASLKKKKNYKTFQKLYVIYFSLVYKKYKDKASQLEQLHMIQYKNNKLYKYL